MEFNGVYKFSPSGVVTTFGKQTYGGSFADGKETNAAFSYPQGLAADKTGNVYVADQGNRRIRKISSLDNYVSTFAGSGDYGHLDGTGTVALFGSPTHLCIDPRGNLFVSDAFYITTNNNYIRKITPSGIVTTIAGKG